jgi:Xaa-Pro aminopeptidase
MITPADYADRRQRLADLLPGGLALFPGNAEAPMNYGANLYPFRQDGSFRYFFGVFRPDLVGTVDLDTGAAVLYGDDPTLADLIWLGPQTPLADEAQAVGVTDIRPLSRLQGDLAAAQAARREIHVLPPYRGDTRLQLERLLGWPAATVHERASEALIRAVVALREIKTEAEVEEIEAALDVAYAMHTEAMRAGKPGVTEHEVYGRVRGTALAAASKMSFPIILSVRGETLHGTPSDHVIEDGDFVLCDAGAIGPMGYTSDITRTFPASGRFSDRQRAIYTAVLEAQEAAIGAIKPDVRFRDVHLLAARVLTEHLQKLGLMRGDLDQSVAQGAHALFFPHGLGHMLGLDVHDMEGLGEDFVGYDAEVQRSEQFGTAYLRLGKRLKEGFVVTVEPGCYFIPELVRQWKTEGQHADFIDYDAVEEWLGFGGVRIEDDVLVTATGARVLGPRIPKTIEEVEAACSGR